MAERRDRRIDVEHVPDTAFYRGDPSIDWSGLVADPDQVVHLTERHGDVEGRELKFSLRKLDHQPALVDASPDFHPTLVLADENIFLQ